MPEQTNCTGNECIVLATEIRDIPKAKRLFLFLALILSFLGIDLSDEKDLGREVCRKEFFRLEANT